MDIRVLSARGRVPVSVFHIAGDIDTHSYQQLEDRAEKARSEGAGEIVLDMSAVEYVSSAGIRAINHIYRLLRTSSPDESDDAVREGIRAGTFKSPHLKLASVNPRVQEALKVAGIDMFLELHPDLASAIDSF